MGRDELGRGEMGRHPSKGGLIRGKVDLCTVGLPYGAFGPGGGSDPQTPPPATGLVCVLCVVR